MTRKLLFEKDPDDKWYVILPEFQGDREELQMVSGADTMLEMFANGEPIVSIIVSDEPLGEGDMLNFIRYTPISGGADYLLYKHEGEIVNLDVWLCDVTLQVFNSFPSVIYIK